jgi:hypothetical protein
MWSAGAELDDSMGKAALVAIPASILLVPHAQCLLVKHVRRSKFFLCMGESTIWILAYPIHKGFTEPRLA